MSILAIVTARGGSKGFPGKNLAKFAGRSLVAWAHKHLQDLRTRGHDLDIYLSTDLQEIADEWPVAHRPQQLRPAYLAADDTSSFAVLEYEIAAYTQRIGKAPETILLLQPTSPGLHVDYLDALLQKVYGGAASAYAVYENEHPLAWNFIVDTRGNLKKALDQELPAQRQAAQKAYLPAGAYAINTDVLLEQKSFFIPRDTAAVIVKSEDAIDIDRMEDLLLLQETRNHAASITKSFSTARHKIGPQEPCYIIAEAGVNHNGSMEVACEMIRVAAEAGASAVKFQTFDPKKLVSAQADKADYQQTNTGTDESQQDMLAALALSVDDHDLLIKQCEKYGIDFLSTPFEQQSLELLEEFDIPLYKIPSGEITNFPFLQDVAKTKKPIILSSGMSTLAEVEDALACLRQAGAQEIIPLHCVSSYPAPAEAYNLRAVESMQQATRVPCGLSDHTLGWEVSLAAVARGASVIEKHFTIDRSMSGPDHAASLEPDELKSMITQIRSIESALGDGVKRIQLCEQNTKDIARKSLLLSRDMQAGEVISEADICIKRPGTGMAPEFLQRVIGKKLQDDLAAETPLQWDMLV